VTGYWRLTPADAARALGVTLDGLRSTEAEARLAEHGPNVVRARRRLTRLRILWRQLESPLLLMLVFAAAGSAVTGEWVDSAIVLAIVAVSAGIGYQRESRANVTAEALAARLHTRVNAIRDARSVLVPIEHIVPGDVVILSAGSLVPGDGLVVESTDLFVSEAALTGESFPAAKRPGMVPADAFIAQRTNSVFLGTNVRSGTARCLVVATGSGTEYGRIATRLVGEAPDTEFERGLRHFGYALTVAMLIMIVAVLTALVLIGRPPLNTLLFAVALAVGLSPELLPAILTFNLSRSAEVMARHGVLVRRLNAIENLGGIDVLCTDKTGTLTEGVMTLEGSYDAAGDASEHVLWLAAVNAGLETGIGSPLDDAILAVRRVDSASIRKLAEIPFDFVRKRVSVVVEQGGIVQLIVKGAFQQTLASCSRLEDGTPLTGEILTAIAEHNHRWNAEGVRVLAVAVRTLPARTAYGREDETDLAFAGFLTFTDKPKPEVAPALADLAALGVRIKMITGDTQLVAQHVATLVGLDAARVLTGAQLQELSEPALLQAASGTDLFVEVDPNQKERIIRALRRAGHTVGFLGDGVNDAPAMHAADTSVSVDDAVDVAREAADFVLLDRDLNVIRRGIEEGRRTFANTMKYIMTTTSANLGNMVSMAVASVFLPFLPLLPGQILLNNFLSDVPAVGLADDHVDAEQLLRPGRWNVRSVTLFMIVFGLVSSAFDFLTFGLLLRWYADMPEAFRTAWFVESLLTELAVALVIRTQRAFVRSRPGAVLLWSTVLLVPLTLALPYLPFSGLFGLVPVPGTVLGVLCAITLAYMLVAELVKRPIVRRL